MPAGRRLPQVLAEKGEVMTRDPRTDPAENDVLHLVSGGVVFIDRVTETEVAYRVTDGHGGLLAAHRTPLYYWRRIAPLSEVRP